MTREVDALDKPIPIDRRYEYRKVDGKWKRCLRPEVEARQLRARQAFQTSVGRSFMQSLRRIVTGR